MIKALRILGFVMLALMLTGSFVVAQDTGEGSTTPLDALSDYALWSIVAGFVGSWVVAGINRYNWSSLTKYAVFFAWCFVAAGVTAYTQRTLDVDNWFRSLLLVAAAGQVTYRLGKPAIKDFEEATG